MSGAANLSNSSELELCPWDSNMTWDSDRVTANALHNLTFVCPFLAKLNDPSAIERKLENPATFFVQVARLSLSLSLTIVLVLLYNSVTVLGRTVLSVATCSFNWIIMFILLALKAMIFVILVPSVTGKDSVGYHSDINQAGFVSVTLLQCTADFMMFLALDHEQRFRSSDYAIMDTSPYSKSCLPVTCRRVVWSWYRLLGIISIVVPLTLLASVEIVFKIYTYAPAPLVWIFILSLYLPRLCILLLIVKIFFLKDSLRPTVVAKVCLVLGFLFSIADHLPSSVTTVAPYAHFSDPPSNEDCKNPCQLEGLTVFDLFQLLGAVSLILYTLFVRSQYLRIEHECKLAIVWDIQRLLNVNGRDDVIAS